VNCGNGCEADTVEFNRLANGYLDDNGARLRAQAAAILMNVQNS